MTIRWMLTWMLTLIVKLTSRLRSRKPCDHPQIMRSSEDSLFSEEFCVKCGASRKILHLRNALCWVDAVGWRAAPYDVVGAWHSHGSKR